MEHSLYLELVLGVVWQLCKLLLFNACFFITMHPLHFLNKTVLTVLTLNYALGPPFQKVIATSLFKGQRLTDVVFNLDRLSLKNLYKTNFPNRWIQTIIIFEENRIFIEPSYYHFQRFQKRWWFTVNLISIRKNL